MVNSISLWPSGSTEAPTTWFPVGTAMFVENGNTMYLSLSQTFMGVYSSEWFANASVSLTNPATTSITTTTASTTTTTISSTTSTVCGVWSKVIVGNNIQCNGWEAVLQSLGTPNSAGVYPAVVALYLMGTWKGSPAVMPGSAAMAAYPYNGNVSTIYLGVSQTFEGVLASQRWANMTLSTVNPTSTTTTPSTTTVPTTTTMPYSIAVPLTKLSYAHESNPQNLTDGRFMVQFVNIQDNNATGGIISFNAPVILNIYYNGMLNTSSAIPAFSSQQYNFSGHSFIVLVNETYGGRYTYQTWAMVGIENWTSTPTSTTTSPTTHVGCGVSFKAIVGDSIQCDGWDVWFQNLGQTNPKGIAPALVAVSYMGAPVGTGSMMPNETDGYTSAYKGNASSMQLSLGQTFDGYYSYQKWANFTIHMTTPSSTNQTTTSPTTHEGCGVPFKTIVGDSILCDVWEVTLQNLGVNVSGRSPAELAIYYMGALVNEMTVMPQTTVTYKKNNSAVYMTVGQTFAGYYAYQKWANVSISLIPPSSQSTALNNTTVQTTVPTSTTVSPIASSSSRKYANYTLVLKPGWNLFSLPLEYATNMSGTCTSSDIVSPVWQLYSGQYVQASSLRGGVGYWLKASAGCMLNFSGPALSESDLTTLTPGWNLVGALNYTTSFASIRGTCNTVGSPMGFNTTTNKYYNASSAFVPGEGYFVNVTASCSLANGEQPPAPP